jgi:hypothetical protein
MGELNSLKRLLSESPSLSVGILTADLLRLGSEVRLLEEEGAHMMTTHPDGAANPAR